MMTVLLLLLGAGISFAENIEVNRCCPEGEQLDTSDSTSPRCVSRSGAEGASLTITGLDLTKDQDSRNVSMTLTYGPNPKMPECAAKTLSTLMKDSWLTTTGHLVQNSKKHQLRHKKFCVDRNTEGGTVAVTCSACTKGHPCINLCCPHGDAVVEDPVTMYEVCGTQTLGTTLSAEFWSKHDTQMEEWQESKGLILKAPSKDFECPAGSLGIDRLHTEPDFDNTKYTVTGEGHLHGQGINYTYDGDDKFGDFTWKNDQFCVGFADMDYDYYSDGEFQLTMFTCSLSAVSSSASVVADNFSSAIFVSVFFFKWCY